MTQEGDKSKEDQEVQEKEPLNQDQDTDSKEEINANPSCCCCAAGEPEPNALASNAILERSRCCTDWPMLLAFLAFLVGMGIVAELAFVEGNPERIMYGTNWQGNTCHTGKLEGFDAQFWANPFYYKEMGSLCLSPETIGTESGCPESFPWDHPGEAQLVCYCNNKLYEKDEASLHDSSKKHPVDDVNHPVGFNCQTQQWQISTLSGTFQAGETITGQKGGTALIARVTSSSKLEVYSVTGDPKLGKNKDEQFTGGISGATGLYIGPGARTAKFGGAPIDTTGFFAQRLYKDATAASNYGNENNYQSPETALMTSWDDVLPQASTSGMYLSTQYCIPSASDPTNPESDPAYPACAYFRRVVPVCNPTYRSKKMFNRCIPTLDFSDVLNLFGAEACGGKKLEDVDQGAENNAEQKEYCAKDKMSELFGGFQEWATQAFADLERCWDIVLAMGFVALGIGFVYLFVMRYAACCIIWSTMIVIEVALIGMALGFLYYYDKLQDRLDIKPKLESHKLDERNANILLAFAIIFGILAAVQAGLMVCFGKHITAAARILMCAAEALTDMPYLVFYPIGNVLVLLVVFVLWCIVTLFLASAGSDHFDVEWNTHEWAYDTELKQAFVYWLFGLFWIIEFIAAVGFMVIAFCTAIWFFAPRPDGADAKSEEREMPPNTLSKAIKMTMCHHLGTVATGSLIIAVVQMIRVMLEYAEKKKKELGLSDNPFVKFIFCVLRCCMWCLEKCVRWLNKHVYIQVVISGCWFCTGICKVCRALYSNLGYITMCGYVSTAMLWFGKIAISLSTAAIGVTACEHRELSSVFFPAFVMAVIGFGIAIMFCEVYELVIDTMLMCFCEAKMNNSGCIPSRLESMMEENYQKSKEAAVAEGMARLAAAEAENADSKESKEPQGKELDPVKTKVEEVPTSNGELSKPLLDEMHSKFERYDLDGSNSINSHEELQQLMVNLYFALSTKGIPNVRPEEIASRVESAGDMEKNNWSFDEWSSWVQLKFPEICEYKG